MICRDKILFHTAAIAEDARREYCAANKKDKRNRRLVVYPCPHCGHFHLGHLRRESKPQPVPQPKQPTAGDLRRAAKRAAKADARKAERAARFADWRETLRHIEWLIERDFAQRAPKLL